jgi:tRNA A-37 threonylcarbamoyl transferase component Bud32/class 3 adenylate cyclase
MAIQSVSAAPVTAGRNRTGQWARKTVATFLYARLHNFAAICQTLAGEELTAFVNDARRALSDPVTKLGGEIAQRRPDSILAVFSNKPDARKPDHAQRGLHSAILAVYESVQLAKRVAAGAASAGSPRLAVAVGVSLGPAEISGRGVRSNGMVHATGEAVEIARLLEMTASDLRWSIAASGRALRASAGRAQAGRIGSVAPPDNSFIDIVEITGLVPRKGSQSNPEMYRLLREAIAQNEDACERPHDAVSGAGPAAPPSGTHHLLVEGYRVLRQIGAGGMATVYLAEAKEGGAPQVLKVMRMDAIPDDDGLQRFIQEFALVAQIRHPNVARIYRQDFSAGNAYIAMEYFSGGDLRGRIAQGIPTAAAIDYLKQIAAGLAAVHEAGIVHRDLKPDNLMLRQDGTLALADFGVAKQVSMLMMDTGDGDVVGTPSYLSPEQAQGLPVDARCDLYSLGVLTYEMLTGRRPYHAANTQAMLDLHIHGLVPVLGAPHEALQPVLNRLMAKDREQRYPSALALLQDLAERGF